MMSKHTPGPWTAQRDPGAVMADDWCIGAGSQIDMVAVCSERDARLIAAAPELLEALIAVRAWDVSNLALDVPLEIRRQMQAAIAKATGGAE